MKTLLTLSLLCAVAMAHAQSTSAAPPAGDGAKRGQLWVGVGALSYERFRGKAGSDEFGFTPTGYLGYQRNFYPKGRGTNGVGYALGIGAYGFGAAAFYQQGATSRRGVDFRVGLAPDYVYDRHASSLGDSNHFSIVPFLVWGVKL